MTISNTDRFEIRESGFTIVELLVVIVVIGILAAITVVAYTGISQKAIVSSLQSDLANASKKLKLYQVDHGSFPSDIASNCPAGSTPVDANYCLKPSSGNVYTYKSYSPYQVFCLKSAHGAVSYHASDSQSPSVSGGGTAVFTSGGVITDDGCNRVHTFTPATGGGSFTAANSGTITITVSGAGGGGGGEGGYGGGTYGPDFKDSGDGVVGGNTTLTLNGTTYTAYGGGGGIGGDWDGGSLPAYDGTPGNSLSYSLTGIIGGGSGGGASSGSDDWDNAGGAGGAGGEVAGSLNITTGQSVNIVIGSGGGGGGGSSNCGAGECADGGAGSPGVVTIRYPY